MFREGEGDASVPAAPGGGVPIPRLYPASLGLVGVGGDAEPVSGGEAEPAGSKSGLAGRRGALEESRGAGLIEASVLVSDSFPSSLLFSERARLFLADAWTTGKVKKEEIKIPNL
jgi:hypothetical protein